MRSVLDHATRADICEDPFPHLVLQPVLDDSDYERLAAGFPAPEVMTPLETKGRFAYRARDIMADARMDPAWHAFTAIHVASAFYRRVIAVFGDHIRSLHPDLEDRLGKSLEDIPTGMRFGEGPREVSLECQCICTEAAAAPTRIIGPHVDRPVALYAGLYYFRADRDESEGGDLELYRFKPGLRGYVEGTRQVPDQLVERVAVVPYRRNTLVLFPHSRDSIHGVSIRSPSRFARRHVNLVGELGMEVYDLCREPSLPSLAD
jgi:hypothetical protein